MSKTATEVMLREQEQKYMEMQRKAAHFDALLAAAKAALPILAREYPLVGSPTYRALRAAIAAAESREQVSA